MFSLPSELIQNVIVCVSPSKTFNVAALHAATVIIPNEDLRNKVSRGINTDELGEPNLLAIPGTIAAYTQGHQWVHELREQIQKNVLLVTTFCEQSIPEVAIVPGTATYLMWIDVSQLTNDATKLETYIRQETGLFVSDGSVYRGNGHLFLRMNVASPTSMVKDGLNRLKTGIEKFENLQ